MPTISIFYGIIISMYYKDDKQHSMPHIHADYQGKSAVFSIPDGNILAGSFPPKKRKLVQAWIEIRHEDLLANWELAVNGKMVFPIDPLR
ncbi:MAG: DUF4160 domain-containing protein [Prevotellaceae bacterium]|jgi:hypothetical protein|nr:DUF4160 domain-containing protein [Prevotellaceae bacterium]